MGRIALCPAPGTMVANLQSVSTPTLPIDMRPSTPPCLADDAGELYRPSCVAVSPICASHLDRRTPLQAVAKCTIVNLALRSSKMDIRIALIDAEDLRCSIPGDNKPIGLQD